MSANYGPADTGETRRRVFITEAFSPVDALPHIVFYEEEVVKHADGTESRVRLERKIRVDYDPNAVVQRRNPADGSLTGETVTHSQIYADIYSLGRQGQTEADLAE